MREFFKYQYGYVNVDDKNIYFTNGGNWTEVTKLTERTQKNKTNNKWRRNRMQAMYALILLAVFIFFLSRLVTSEPSAAMFIEIPLVVFGIYKYFQTELGPTFLIPRNKIKSIKKEDENLSISFLNGDDEVDNVTIVKPEYKAFSIFEI